MSKTYYKVTNNCLQSIWIEDPRLKTQYKMREFVKSPIPQFPLSVFKTKDAALDFITRLPYLHKYNARLFECKIKTPTRTPWLIGKLKYIDDMWIDYRCTDKISWLLKQMKSKKKFMHYVETDLPNGTITCREVKLTKEVFKS